MKESIRLLIAVMMILADRGIAQSPEWIVYTPSNSTLPGQRITSIVIDHSNQKWVATRDDGISTFDDKAWFFHDAVSIGLRSDIGAMLVNSNGHIFATDYGITQFGISEWDGNKWTLIHPAYNSNPYIHTLAYSFVGDKYGNIYYGSEALNYVKYDGKAWYMDKYPTYDIGEQIYAIALDSTDNLWLGSKDDWESGDYGIIFSKENDKWNIYFPDDAGALGYTIFGSVNAISIDKYQNKWIGKSNSGGLIKFDDKIWTEFTTSNSGLPHNNVYAITLDKSGNKWIGTEGGLVKYNDTTWTVYTKSNSGLPDDYITAIVVDKYDNKWIGTYSGGLAVFRKGGVILGVEDEEISKEIGISPNPARDEITIFGLNRRANPTVDGMEDIRIYNILGECVKKPHPSPPQGEGVRIDVSGLESGVYSIRIGSITKLFVKK